MNINSKSITTAWDGLVRELASAVVSAADDFVGQDTEKTEGDHNNRDDCKEKTVLRVKTLLKLPQKEESPQVTVLPTFSTAVSPLEILWKRGRHSGKQVDSR